MTIENEQEFLMLEMRKACAGMEHANQRSTRDLARGEWQMDHSAQFALYQNDYDEAAKKLRELERL